MSFYNERVLGPIKNVPCDEYELFMDTPIYQILPLKYALFILQNKKLRFGNIWDHWEDPYELFMYKQNVNINGCCLNDILMHLGKSTFGQCWSIKKDTDAMWRIYSPDKTSVQIKTTFGKVMKVMNETRGMTIYENGKILYTFVPHFGRVIYKPQAEIETWINSASGLNPFEYYTQCDSSLFVKRLEFEHENEIRFVIVKSKYNDVFNLMGEYEDAIFMNVEPMDFIDEIRIDPRVDDVSYREIKLRIDSISPGLSITRSQLYSFNSNTIELADTPIKLKGVFID